MNKRVKLVLLLSLISTFLNAEVLEIELLGEKNQFDKKLGYKDAYGFGIRENIFLLKNHAIQLSMDKLNNVSKKDFPFLRYSINYLFRYRENRIEPFIALGGGVEKGFEKKGIMNCSIGTNIKINRDISLVAEVKAIGKDDDTFDVSTNLGIGFFPKLNIQKANIKPDPITEKYAVNLKKTDTIPTPTKPAPVRVFAKKIVVSPKEKQENNIIYNDTSNYKNYHQDKMEDIPVFDDEEYTVVSKY